MFAQQFNSKTLPNELENMLMHTSNIHNHFTRISSNSGLFIPQISSTNFKQNGGVDGIFKLLKFREMSH